MSGWTSLVETTSKFADGMDRFGISGKDSGLWGFVILLKQKW
jgi:hypothetical protein